MAGVIAYRQSISVLTGQSNWTVCAIVRVAIEQLLFCVFYSSLAKNSRKFFLFSGNDYLVTEAWFRLILSEISALVIKQMGLPLGNHSHTCMTTDRTYPLKFRSVILLSGVIKGCRNTEFSEPAGRTLDFFI